MAELLLEVEGLQRSFGTRQAVKGISFTIHEGETYGLLGPNGAGLTSATCLGTG